MAKTFEEYKAEAKKQTDPSRNRDIATIDNSADASIKLANDTYSKSVNDTEADYNIKYESNAVQKLINEKKIAEKNANLGLTDSGLNRTQQTAVQLSYANQKGKIDLARQQALDKLSGDLAAYVTGINNQREADKLNVNQFYDQQNNTIATEMYNTDANAAVQKAAIEAKPLNVWTYTGITDDNGYVAFMNSDGTTQLFKKGVNPYTGTVNIDIYKGTFKDGNGYQPNNIKGKKLAQMEGYKAVNDLGETLKVWTTDGGETLYVWDALRNRYEDVTDQKEELKK